MKDEAIGAILGKGIPIKRPTKLYFKGVNVTS